MTRSISEDLDYLKHQSAMNGNSILKRWKKSAQERKALLLQVDPKMYPHDWSEAHFAREDHQSQMKKELEPEKYFDNSSGLVRRPYENVCLLPYVNVEALKKDPLRFLNLLYNRVKFSPAQWAPHENFILSKQWRLGTFETAYNGNSIIMYGPRYGEYTTWNQEAAHDWTAIGFPRAMLILRAQERLMKLLRALVENLQYGLRKANERGDMSNSREFASVYLNQPFSAPPAFDIEALLSIAQTQLNKHGNHLWLLQTEPSYMRRQADLIIAGGLRENLTKRNQSVATVVGLMQDAIWSWCWEWIVEEVQKVRNIQLGVGDSLSPMESPPEQYEDALGALEALLGFLLRFYACYIYFVLPQRPGFQSSWKIEALQQLQSSIIMQERADKTITYPQLFFNDRLDWCLSVLVHYTNDIDFDKMVRGDYTRTFAILDEHLAEASQKGNKAELARLNEVLYTMYSDLSGIHQMLAMVRLHQPHFPERNFEEAKRAGTTRGWRYIRNNFTDQVFARRVRPSPDYSKYEPVFKLANVEEGSEKVKAEQHLAQLLEDFKASPQPKGPRLIQSWLKQDQVQRAALGKFWEGMRD
jgi:hypothetical protein